MNRRPMRNLSPFSEKVLKVVKAIPRGSVLSYGEVARRAGNAKGARAVGTLMSHNTDLFVPCHRVVRSDGGIGAYNGLRGAKGPKGKLAVGPVTVVALYHPTFALYNGSMKPLLVKDFKALEQFK